MYSVPSLRRLINSPARFTAGQMRPHVAVGCLGCFAGSEDIRIPAHHLVRRVSGHPGEIWIDVLDPASRSVMTIELELCSTAIESLSKASSDCLRAVMSVWVPSMRNGRLRCRVPLRCQREYHFHSPVRVFAGTPRGTRNFAGDVVR